jgi:acetoin utilization protein AcuB
MTRDPMTVEVHAKIADALEILQTLEIRHLPIVDRKGALVGMISDRDIRNAALPFTAYNGVAGIHKDLLAKPVVEIMSSDITTINPETDVSEIIDLLLELKIGALPVVDDETNDLVGIVSYVDVLRALRDKT